MDFYCLPVLSGILDELYFGHLVLVAALHILWSDHITLADFSIALKCLALDKKPIVPQRTLANFSTRAVTILQLPHTCISQCTIPTVIFTMCTQSLPPPSHHICRWYFWCFISIADGIHICDEPGATLCSKCHACWSHRVVVYKLLLTKCEGEQGLFMSD